VLIIASRPLNQSAAIRGIGLDKGKDVLDVSFGLD
jgi:hypothetical protein